MKLKCHIKDASLTHRKYKNDWYCRTPTISQWHSVSMLNAEDLFAMATDKTTKWLNGIVPDDQAVSALA